MSVLREIIAAFLVLAWLSAVNACPLANAFPHILLNGCCETDSPAPAHFDACASCSALESGRVLSELTPVAIPALSPVADAWLTELLAAQARGPAGPSLFVEPDAIPPQPSLWQFVSRTALPARGPSLA